MDAIFMNSGNSKTSNPHEILLNFSDKINLKRSDKYVALSNFSIYYARKKKSYKNSKFKLSAPSWNEKFEYLMGRILCQIFKIISSISLKSMKSLLITLQQPRDICKRLWIFAFC